MTVHNETHADNRTKIRLEISVEALLFGVLLLGALLLRVTALGYAPLTQSEAEQALAAHTTLSQTATQAGSVHDPVSFLGLLLSFALLGPNNMTARIVTFISGMLLVLVPILYRRELGKVGTLAAVAWLALSPAMVMYSRRITGVNLAILAVIIASLSLIRYVHRRDPQSLVVAGVASSFALLADYGSLFIFLSMAVGFGYMKVTDEEEIIPDGLVKELFTTGSMKPFLIAFGGTVALVSTVFFFSPDGLGHFTNLISEFLQGFVQQENLDAVYPGLVLLVYETGTLLFGFAGAWIASQSPEPWKRFMAGWGISALVLLLVYPGAGPVHVVWVMVPFSMLSGTAVTELLSLERFAPSWLHPLFVAVTGGLFATTIGTLARHLRDPLIMTVPANAPPEDIQLTIAYYMVLTTLWVLLLVVGTFAVSGLWSFADALSGVGKGILIVCLSLALGRSIQLSITSPTTPYNVMIPSPAQDTIYQMKKSVEEVSNLAVGHPLEASITVDDLENDAVAWILRDMVNIQVVDNVTPDVDTVMVITSATDVDPTLGSSYVGQDIVISRTWKPQDLFPEQFAWWMIYQNAITRPQEDRIILWVRDDIYRLTQADTTP